MPLTQDERAQLKQWIVKCTDYSTVRLMQDETPEAREHNDTFTKSVKPMQTYRQSVKWFKYYAARNGGFYYQELMTCLQRGGFDAAALQLTAESRGMSYYEIQRIGNCDVRNDIPHLTQLIPYWGGLAQARTGFFDIDEDEYDALRNPTKKMVESAHFKRTAAGTLYDDIYRSRPVDVLLKCDHKEFLEIRTEALREKGWLVGVTVAAVSNSAPAVAPTPILAAGSHAARVAPASPTESWAQDAAARANQTELLERLSAGLALAAQQSADMDSLMAQMFEKQVANKSTLADVQELQRQIVALQKGRGA
jgi:hypothetical protein